MAQASLEEQGPDRTYTRSGDGARQFPVGKFRSA